MNPAIMEEHPKETFNKELNIYPPALAPLGRSCSAIPAKQEAISQTEFLANSFIVSCKMKMPLISYLPSNSNEFVSDKEMLNSHNAASED